MRQDILFTSKALTSEQLHYHLDRCGFPLSKNDGATTNFRYDRNRVVYFIERATRELGWLMDSCPAYRSAVEQLQDGDKGLETKSRHDIFELGNAYWEMKEMEAQHQETLADAAEYGIDGRLEQVRAGDLADEMDAMEAQQEEAEERLNDYRYESEDIS